MKFSALLSRRALLHLAAFGAAGSLLPRAAQAQTAPMQTAPTQTALDHPMPDTLTQGAADPARIIMITDLEGPWGVSAFADIRTAAGKAKAQAQLAREVAACIAGVRSVEPDVQVDVYDAHGGMGLTPDAIPGVTYYTNTDHSKPKRFFHLEGHVAAFFVGQHAMAGAFNAPLAHTYSSRDLAYVRLNGVNVGEFACISLVMGLQGTPVVFASGDDKLCLEAQSFVPEIETAATKRGLGLNAAEQFPLQDVLDRIREGAARGYRRRKEIPPLTALQPPYVLEMRFRSKEAGGYWLPEAERIAVDDYTWQLKRDDLRFLSKENTYLL